jgi:dolichol-phosphate mannosyltransferase
MEPRRPSLSLVLPAYNEAEGIGPAVAEADAALGRFADDYEILVVDDGSRDATADVVAGLARECSHVRLLSHDRNRGYGAALRTGFEAARGERVAFTDADGQFDVAELERLVAASRRTPVVVGYRIDRKDHWPRRFFSWGYNQIVRRLIGTGVRDCDCALKVFRRDALRSLLPESTHFFVNTEMLARARQSGLPVAEIGVTHRPRRHGESKVSLGDIPRTLGVLLPFWWSKILFPGDSMPHPRSQAPLGNASKRSSDSRPAPVGESTSKRSFETCAPKRSLATREWVGFALLMVVTGLLFFCRLHSPLLEPEEARYAEIPRQMLAAGRWLVPVLHGQDYLDKPPLYYWLVMSAYQAFGVSEETARVVVGMIALLTVAAVYGWGGRVLGPRAALLAAFVLALCPEFVYRGRMITPNGLLALCTTAALSAGHIARYGPQLRRGWWTVGAFATGLGLLTKGPVALALVLPPLVAVGWLDRRLARVRLSAWAAFVGVACLVAGPWYIAVARQCPEFGGYFFWFHNVRRYVDPFDHAKPLWFYVPQLLLGLLPWTLLLIPLVRLLARRHGRTAARRPGALGFALLTAVWGVAFFSLAGSKRPVYLLPVLPTLAMAFGCTIDMLLPRVRPASVWAVVARHRSAIAYYATVLALVAGVLVGVEAYAAELRKAERGLFLVAGAGIGLLVLARRARRATWLTAGGAMFAFLWFATHDLLPGYAARFSVRRAARPAVAAPAVFCYPQPFDAVSFYLRRDDVCTFRENATPRLVAALLDNPGALVFVKSSHLDELLAALPPVLRFVPSAKEGGVTVGRVLPRPVAPVAGYARAGYDDDASSQRP